MSTFLYIDIFSYSRMKVFLIYLLLLHYIYISTFPYIDINIFFPVDVDISGLHCIFLYLSFIKITCGISLCQYLKCMEIFLNSNFSVKFGIWEKVEISLYKKKLNNVFAPTHFQSYLYNLARFLQGSGTLISSILTLLLFEQFKQVQHFYILIKNIMKLM